MDKQQPLARIREIKDGLAQRLVIHLLVAALVEHVDVLERTRNRRRLVSVIGRSQPAFAQDGSVRIPEPFVEIVRAAAAHEEAAVVGDRAAGQAVDPSLYYFRTTPRFQVQDGPHRWLAENVFVGRGARRPDGVELEVFRLL
jgi:hypothetical protein